MTAGSCSVAISRSRPPQCGHASTSSANARCMSAAQLQAREPLFTFVPSEPPWTCPACVDTAVKGLWGTALLTAQELEEPGR